MRRDAQSSGAQGDELEEAVKWGHLVYAANGPVLLIRAEDERVLFGFWRGQRLREIEPRLKPGGKYEMATLEIREGDDDQAGGRLAPGPGGCRAEQDTRRSDEDREGGAGGGQTCKARVRAVGSLTRHVNPARANSAFTRVCDALCLCALRPQRSG